MATGAGHRLVLILAAIAAVAGIVACRVVGRRRLRPGGGLAHGLLPVVVPLFMLVTDA
jgi:hypothetical protein